MDSDDRLLDFAWRLLNRSQVKQAISSDMARTRVIDHKEPWRLCVLSPNQDWVLMEKTQEIPQGMGRLERTLHSWQARTSNMAILYPRGMFGVRLNAMDVFEGIAVTLMPKRTKTLLVSRPKKGESMSMEEMTVRHPAGFSSPINVDTSARYIPEFLRGLGFPLKSHYDDGSPFRTERGGIIDSAGAIMRQEYFLQRSIIDDEGNLIYLGLDGGGATHTNMPQLVPQVHGELIQRKLGMKRMIPPFLRYHSFPYESDIMLPIIDTPVSASEWVDLVINPGGYGKLYVAKNKGGGEWREMMDRLKSLFHSELANCGFHLLKLTKDERRTANYLKNKESILGDYFVIRDLGKFL